MKTAEELMPGGRWLSVPGTNFESAAYALAAGMTTLMSVQRSLDWSDLTTERQMYDAVKPMCNTQTLAELKSNGIKFDSQRPMDMTSLSFVIQSWNARVVSQIRVHMSCDGQNIPVPSKGHDGCKSVYIRCIANRWEAYGYYQNSATTPGPVKAANTISIITQVEIKPVAVSESPRVANPLGKASNTLPKDANDVAVMVKELREKSLSILPAITKLHRQIELFDAALKKDLQPVIDITYYELRTNTCDAIEFLDTIISDDVSQASKMLIENFRMERIKSGRRNTTFKLVVEPVTPAKSWGQLAAAAHRPLPDTHDPKSRPAADSWENKPMESAVRNLRDISTYLTVPIERLCCWTEVLDVSRNETVRPAINRLFSTYIMIGRIEIEATRSIEDSATEQEKERVLTMMEGFTKPNRGERVNQKKNEAAEQKGDKRCWSESRRSGQAERRQGRRAEKAQGGGGSCCCICFTRPARLLQ
ncbi:uncharacterized protein M437DRAFT_66304 [Aureobasidium melanogenum CBS 110374]|uniref:Uncharacterized protein n=1 Tax=Aureobasidium melanogenum (strain CBS 110374) TaxID=1043003 RepID=A0A074WJ18_AURM1|nr:uncharacterized protein M437DRAFT_66304 [Aureobasidium melanogenum CBS 110374]KEQ62436.1 hypothetical protein M437DRAFT_66304 [Aureobasidium melanogenum CBS 110374]